MEQQQPDEKFMRLALNEAINKDAKLGIYFVFYNITPIFTF